MDKDKAKKIIRGTAIALGATYVVLDVIAKKQKADSTYKNDPDQQNPMQGKSVQFVADENDRENADGKSGHLEATGESNALTRHRSAYEKYGKRAMDKALSFGGLVVLAPVMGTIALAIKIEDPGPVLFTQKRVGQDKQYFKLHKFRSMKMSTPHDVPTHMLENPEQYITKVGGFIRKHSLDELPQIWDIFVGNMSVIGPRPALWNQDVLVAERDKVGANDVKPGLTGWAQINGRDELSIADKSMLDGVYTKSLKAGGTEALKMDLKCFAGSIHVFNGDDSVVEGGTGAMAGSTKGKLREGVPEQDPEEHFACDYKFTVNHNAHKNILIVGSGSYIGESFVIYATEHYCDNFTFTTVDTLPGENGKSELDSLTLDQLANFDIVYHLAGIAHADVGHVDDVTKEKYYKVNTDLAITAARRYKTALEESGKTGLFVFMSSMIVYGDSAPYGEEKIIDRHTSPSPANFYGDSKWQADKGIRSIADSTMQVAIIRPPMIYGKGSKGNYPTLSKLARKLPVFPDVENKRSMLYVENLCEFLCKMFLSTVSDENSENKNIKEQINSLIFIPQNPVYTKTSDMVKNIAEAGGHHISVVKALNLFVVLADKVPGKVNGLVDKAVGNNSYDLSLSMYDGLEYQKYSFEESIKLTELPSPTPSFSDNKLTSLKGKKVLLIALPGYPDGMIKEMQDLGAEVDYIHDKPNEGFVSKTLGRLHVGFYEKVINDYYKNVLEVLKNRDYDYILSIRGEYTPAESLKLMRSYFPHAKMILYMWDGLHKQNTVGIEEKWSLYDKVYTFDRIDYEANKGKIDFLPLYYYDAYLPKDIKNANSNKLKYDLSFIGTGHDDRIRIVKEVMSQCEEQGLKTFHYFFMPHKLVFLKNRLSNPNFKNVEESDVHYEMLPFETLYQTYADSRCVMDVENRGQHGLTMRSIEILGLKRKFITTNKDIVNYDFYNPNNILIIDRENPVVNMDWFKKPYEELDENLYGKYSLRNWILEVLK